MSTFRDVVSKTGRARSVQDAIAGIREAHGAGASRYIADTYGVSMRTAQRWLKGESMPSRRGGRRDAVQRDRSAQMKRAAKRIRSARMVTGGTVRVRTKSRGIRDGSRRIGALRVDDAMATELAAVADALERGDIETAEALMSDAMLGAYSVAKGGSREAARGALYIDDYEDGLNFL